MIKHTGSDLLRSIDLYFGAVANTVGTTRTVVLPAPISPSPRSGADGPQSALTEVRPTDDRKIIEICFRTVSQFEEIQRDKTFAFLHVSNVTTARLNV